jgi:hypothetical protein
MTFKPDETRYEFRQFGKDMTSVRDAFAKLDKGKAQPKSRETYIVTRLNIEANVKIRGAKLQVKTLEARLGVLEQWARPLNAEFPVGVQDIEMIVLPALGVDMELGEEGAFSEGVLLTVVEDQPSLAVQEVVKQRTLYEIGGCVAEFCKLSVGNETVQTIAVEATDAQAALALLAEIGLADGENESYSEYLQRLLF